MFALAFVELGRNIYLTTILSMFTLAEREVRFPWLPSFPCLPSQKGKEYFPDYHRFHVYLCRKGSNIYLTTVLSMFKSP